MRIALATLRIGQQRCVSFQSRMVLVCRTETGVYAVENVCPHAEMPLAGGALSKDTIRCPTHGAKFDLTTGRPLNNPRLPPLRRYLVAIDGDNAVISADQLQQSD